MSFVVLKKATQATVHVVPQHPLVVLEGPTVSSKTNAGKRTVVWLHAVSLEQLELTMTLQEHLNLTGIAVILPHQTYIKPPAVPVPITPLVISPEPKQWTLRSILTATTQTQPMRTAAAWPFLQLSLLRLTLCPSTVGATSLGGQSPSCGARVGAKVSRTLTRRAVS